MWQLKTTQLIITPISCGPGTWAQLGWWLWLGHSHDAVVKLQAGATAIGRAGERAPKLIHRTVIRSLSSFPRETLPGAAHAAWQLAAPRVRDLREREMEGAPPVYHHALPNIHLVINWELYLIALSLLSPMDTITTDPPPFYLLSACHITPLLSILLDAGCRESWVWGQIGFWSWPSNCFPCLTE